MRQQENNSREIVSFLGCGVSQFGRIMMSFVETGHTTHHPQKTGFIQSLVSRYFQHENADSVARSTLTMLYRRHFNGGIC
jgi:hypothetical protein